MFRVQTFNFLFRTGCLTTPAMFVYKELNESINYKSTFTCKHKVNLKFMVLLHFSPSQLVIKYQSNKHTLMGTRHTVAVQFSKHLT